MTTDTAGSAPLPPASVAPAKGSFERLAGVLFSPGETFADIARKPTVLVPLLLLILLGYVSVFLMVPRGMPHTISAGPKKPLVMMSTALGSGPTASSPLS